MKKLNNKGQNNIFPVAGDSFSNKKAGLITKYEKLIPSPGAELEKASREDLTSSQYRKCLSLLFFVKSGRSAQINLDLSRRYSWAFDTVCLSSSALCCAVARLRSQHRLTTNSSSTG